ncbi:hypothetical protein ABI_17640 [Asticcacaulis biprosthecium C19]|uniref:Lipoprotein n=1 Tax=Asticcacaulis biprosthecium C19 TaxID=715226 RepID=F4QKM2_9CAUL|nr:hypothetical protein [Asticcacaulis biprosthecium]EGF93324.1 hypothetical protein ABI_17640 [Asticcacaulis biprosthecium C19]
MQVRLGLGFFKRVAAAAAMLTLSACNMFPVGPDLAKAPTPFGNAAQVDIANADEGMDVQIRHTPDGDRITLTYPMLGKKPYEGDVTYHAIDGTAAETNWLIAANVFQSADRSVYAILKYPKGTTFAPGSETEGSIMMVTCVMRMPSEAEIEAKYNADDNATEEEQSEMLASALGDIMGGCDFNTIEEVHAFGPKVLAAAQEEADINAKVPASRQEDNYEWKPVTITVP